MSLERFEAQLRALDEQLDQNLRLPSLGETPPCLRGYCFKYSILLPLLSATGAEVFTSDHLAYLFSILCRRFAGFSAASSTSHPPLYGFYQPIEGNLPEKDYHTQLVVYAAPLEAANHFFAELKRILRAAPLQPQEEILIERM
ncbi:MAG: hypothetical protein L0Y72_00430, partial [Gemmataceae bacterium]|nr:hypothetical protein [Gemmataceae bacterium]